MKVITSFHGDIHLCHNRTWDTEIGIDIRFWGAVPKVYLGIVTILLPWQVECELVVNSEIIWNKKKSITLPWNHWSVCTSNAPLDRVWWLWTNRGPNSWWHKISGTPSAQGRPEEAALDIKLCSVTLVAWHSNILLLEWSWTDRPGKAMVQYAYSSQAMYSS
jgi:hypothetical protein